MLKLIKSYRHYTKEIIFSVDVFFHNRFVSNHLSLPLFSSSDAVLIYGSVSC